MINNVLTPHAGIKNNLPIFEVVKVKSISKEEFPLTVAINTSSRASIRLGI